MHRLVRAHARVPVSLSACRMDRLRCWPTLCMRFVRMGTRPSASKSLSFSFFLVSIEASHSYDEYAGENAQEKVTSPRCRRTLDSLSKNVSHNLQALFRNDSRRYCQTSCSTRAPHSQHHAFPASVTKRQSEHTRAQRETESRKSNQLARARGPIRTSSAGAGFGG